MKLEVNVIEGYYYTEEHEWIKIEGKKGKVGISDYAQQMLGDITYVEPAEIGKSVKQFDFLTGIESVKAASDIYSPVSGKVLSFNEELDKAPELVNKSPYDKGWIAELEVADPVEVKNLMDAGKYKTYVNGLE